MSAALDVSRTLPRSSDADDAELVARVRGGDKDQFAILIRRYNQRIYRIARSITRDESEAEDVTQQTFVSAYQHLGQYAGRAQFSSWLTRIAVNEAFARSRVKNRYVALSGAEDETTPSALDAPTPEADAIRAEARGMLEAALDRLAEHHRTVFVLRDACELSTAQTAAALEISEEAVRTRLHRARAALRELLLDHFGLAAADVFPFAGARCDRIVAAVFAAIGL
jgi:RNA polymerase sigma-70 factor (ECF subfamily)